MEAGHSVPETILQKATILCRQVQVLGEQCSSSPYPQQVLASGAESRKRPTQADNGKSALLVLAPVEMLTPKLVLESIMVQVEHGPPPDCSVLRMLQ